MGGEAGADGGPVLSPQALPFGLLLQGEAVGLGLAGQLVYAVGLVLLHGGSPPL